MTNVKVKDDTTTFSEHPSNEKHHGENIDQNIHHPKGWVTFRLASYLTIVGLSMGLYGYDNNFASPLIALPYFVQRYQTTGLAFTSRNLTLLITVPLVGAAVGTFLAVPLLHKFGRKWSLIVAYTLFCSPGSFLQLFAPNLGALVVGRFWNYVGISVITTAAPLFLTELVPAHVRGRAVGFCSAGVAAVGVLATTLVWGTQKINDSRSYKIPLALQAAFPAALAILTLVVPESPMWHLQHGHEDAARKILLVLRNGKPDIVDSELVMYQASIAADKARRSNARFWDILNKANIKRTLTAGACLSASQVGGQILVLTYATVLLAQSGVADPFQITVLITCLQFFGTLIGPVLIDKVGRRPVALLGFPILLILNIAGGSLATTGLMKESQQKGLAAVFIIFGFFNAVTFQSLAFILPTEIATPSLREATMSWSVFWAYVTAVITTFAIPQIISPDAANLGAKIDFIFAGCMLVTIVFAYFFFPETKARTVAEIDEMYAIGLPMRKWRKYQCQSVNESGRSSMGQTEKSSA